MNLNDWKQICRDDQKTPPGLWRTWVIIGGRGFGKTRASAKTIKHWCNTMEKKRIGIIGLTISDAKNIMVEGPSGILTIGREDIIKYFPTKGLIKWKNGTTINILSGHDPYKLRGFQFDAIWIDEFLKFKKTSELWTQINFCTREGENPQIIISTTPCDDPILKKIIQMNSTVVSGGSMLKNKDNLSQKYIDFIEEEFGDSVIGGEEIRGEFSQKKSIWVTNDISYKTVSCKCLKDRNIQKLQNNNISFLLNNMNQCLCPFSYVVIGIDPSVNGTLSETGIILAGIYDKKIYIIEDFSVNGPAEEWIKVIYFICTTLKIRNIAVKTNQGGSMLEYILKKNLPFLKIEKYFALSNKLLRARLVSSLYKNCEVVHYKEMPCLENQMKSFHDESYGNKKDRVDALVWSIHHLLRILPLKNPSTDNSFLIN
jgi:phage terminase large subunit-like protein